MADGMPAMVEVAAGKSAVTVRWETAHKAADEELQLGNTAIRAVATTGDSILTGSARPVVKVWKVAEAKVAEESRLRYGAVGCTCIEAAPNERTVAVCSDDGIIGIWDLRSSKRVSELPSQIPIAWKVKFFQGSERLVSGGPSGSLCLWDLRKNSLEREVEPDVMAQLDTTSEMAPLPGAKRARLDNDTASVRSVRANKDGVDKANSPIYSLAVSDNGRLIGCGRGSGNISIMRLDAYDWAGDISAHHGEAAPPVRGLAFDGSGKLLLSGGDDNHVCVLNAAAWARRRGPDESARVPQIERFPAHKGWVTSVSISPDASHRVAISTSWDGTVKLWDYGTHTVLGTYKEHSDSVFASAFAPANSANNYFVTVGADALLTMYVAKG